MTLIPYFTAVHHHNDGLTKKQGIIQCLLLYINSSIPRSGTTFANMETDLHFNSGCWVLWMWSDLECLFSNAICGELSIKLCNFSCL